METTPAQTYVIALCAMTRPIPIPQPRSSALNRYRFFLTRREADGREFFVLHMGYFANASEAEKWLNVLRSTYPNAYVSDTTEPVEESIPSVLSDTQVMRVLEVRHPVPDEQPDALRVVETPREKVSGKTDALRKSLETLAAKESDTGNYEAVSDTGVRHLRIEVDKGKSGWLWRSRKS
jgi:hypothetical protein